MTLRQIECFLAVADHLSFTKAAAHLGLAQPPLSQHIRRLESEFGAPLFTRSHRRVNLTDVGRAFLPRARALAQQADIARSEIRAMAGLERAELRVGASGTLAAFLLPDLVAAYRERFASVSVHIEQHRSEPLLRRIEDGDLDVGLLRLPIRATELEITRLAGEPLYAALPPDHPRASDASLPIHALRHDAFIMCVDRREPFYTVVSDLCLASGFLPNVICAGAEYTTVFRLVGMGLGVSIASALATRLRVDPPPRFVPLADPGASIDTAIVTGPRSTRAEAADAFRALALRWHREGVVETQAGVSRPAARVPL